MRAKRPIILIMLTIAAALLYLSSCSGCPSEEEVPMRVSSDVQTLQLGRNMGAGDVAKDRPNVRVINIGPSKELDGEETAEKTLESGAVPKEVVLDDALTTRLKTKLEEAFKGKSGTPPNIEIFTGVMSLDAFANHYEEKGLKIQRTSVPASQIIAPLLDEKPELADKISLSNYAGITINQVIVEGQNISAADKYIDPVTYEVVYKTFVTVTK